MRFSPAAIWAPAGDRLFIQAEAAQGDQPSHLLFVYHTDSGSLRRYRLAAKLDFRKYSALLRAPQADLERLLALVPQLEGGPLAVLGPSAYLAGTAGRLSFFAPQTGLSPLREFSQPILDLSLSQGGRRLAILTGRKGETTLYAWRLPETSLLAGVFPDRRDLIMGGISLGAKESELLAAWGTPSSREHAADPRGGHGEFTILRYPQAAAYLAGGRVVRIIYSSPGVSTGRGIGIGAPLEDVYEHYGRPAYQTLDYLSYYGEVEGLRIKVAFTLSQRKVRTVLVARD